MFHVAPHLVSGRVPSPPMKNTAMFKTVEQTILAVRRALPPEFRYHKPSTGFCSDRVGLWITGVDSFTVVVTGGPSYSPKSCKEAINLALKHHKNPGLAEQSLKWKGFASKKKQEFEEGVKSSLEGLGFPVECLSENGRRGLQVAVTDHNIQVRVTLSSVKRFRELLMGVTL